METSVLIPRHLFSRSLVGYSVSERFPLIVEQLSGVWQGSASSGPDDAVAIGVRAQKSGLKRSAEHRRAGGGGDVYLCTVQNNDILFKRGVVISLLH